MEFRDYFRVLRRSWLLIIVLVVLGAVAGGVLGYLQPRQYATTAKAFVSVQSAQTTSDLTNGATYAQLAARGYADVVTTSYVLQPVIDELDLRTTPIGLARRVSVSVADDSPVISITVTDAFATRAAKTANAIAQQLSSAADQLTPEATSSLAATSVVKLTPVDPAVINRDRVGIRPAFAIAAGGLAGLVLAVLIGLIRELLDTRVRTRQDLQRVTDAPLLGATMRDPEARRNPLVVDPRGTSPRAEPYRTIRTNLRFVELDDSRRSLVVTSSVDGEGKTSTAANLALAVAGLGVRVLLVDADLRRPRVADLFDIEGAIGLTDVLIDSATLEQSVQAFGESGLDLLPAGTLPPNPNEQLQSQAMGALMHRLHSAYDLVLFDSPPLLAVSDAAVLGVQTGGVIVVAAAGHVRRPQLDAALENLERVGARIAGLVLTMVPRAERDSHRYGYGYTPGTSAGAEAPSSDATSGLAALLEAVGDATVLPASQPRGRRAVASAVAAPQPVQQDDELVLPERSTTNDEHVATEAFDSRGRVVGPLTPEQAQELVERPEPEPIRPASEAAPESSPLVEEIVTVPSAAQPAEQVQDDVDDAPVDEPISAREEQPVVIEEAPAAAEEQAEIESAPEAEAVAATSSDEAPIESEAAIESEPKVELEPQVKLAHESAVSDLLVADAHDPRPQPDAPEQTAVEIAPSSERTSDQEVRAAEPQALDAESPVSDVEEAESSTTTAAPATAGPAPVDERPEEPVTEHVPAEGFDETAQPSPETSVLVIAPRKTDAERRRTSDAPEDSAGSELLERDLSWSFAEPAQSSVSSQEDAVASTTQPVLPEAAVPSAEPKASAPRFAAGPLVDVAPSAEPVRPARRRSRRVTWTPGADTPPVVEPVAPVAAEPAAEPQVPVQPEPVATPDAAVEPAVDDAAALPESESAEPASTEPEPEDTAASESESEPEVASAADEQSRRAPVREAKRRRMRAARSVKPVRVPPPPDLARRIRDEQRRQDEQRGTW